MPPFFIQRIFLFSADRDEIEHFFLAMNQIFIDKTIRVLTRGAKLITITSKYTFEWLHLFLQLNANTFEFNISANNKLPYTFTNILLQKHLFVVLVQQFHFSVMSMLLFLDIFET